LQPWTFAELDLHWRRWLQLEVRRRTTYFIFIFDALATIETSIPCICAPAEVCFIPLPAPDSLWKAQGGESWLIAARDFKPMTLDQALRVLFTRPQTSAGPSISQNKEAGSAHQVGFKQLDRFALHVIILLLLRGVIEIGEGRRERGDWYDLTDLWLDRDDADEWILRSFPPGAGRPAILEVFTNALQLVSLF
jgi:hypothetical protein